MEANPDYWLGAPKIDELVFRVFQNDEALIQALEQGEIDFAYDIQSPDCSIPCRAIPRSLHRSPPPSTSSR